MGDRPFAGPSQGAAPVPGAPAAVDIGALVQQAANPDLTPQARAKLVDEIDRVTAYLGLRVLFVLRLFPLLGVDIISYAAGLTPIRYLPYIVISIVATMPVLALTSAIGEGVRENREVALAAILGLGVFLILPLAYIAIRNKRAGVPFLNIPDAEAGAESAPSTD